MRNRKKLINTLAVIASALSLCAAAAPAAKQLPPQPWHVADIWWHFTGPTPHFGSLDMEVTIDRDVATNVNLYLRLP